MSGGLHLDDPRSQYIARISHGKDSLKMLDVIVSRGLRLDRITTTDIWATDTIRGEHPEMVEFKARADEYIWRRYRIEVEHLCAMRNGEKVTYEKLFYHVPKRKPEKCRGDIVNDKGGSSGPRRCGDRGIDRTSNGTRTGRPQGFPAQIGSWCKKLKIDYIRIPSQCRSGRGSAYQAQNKGFRQPHRIVEYLGIAADEPKRFGQLNDRKRAPLVEFGIEEGLCGLHCQYEGILDPSYGASCRDGCWMCHNQGVDQLRQLRKNHPELGALLLKWDVDSPVSFKPNGRTVHDHDRRFQMEDEGLIRADDRGFRWSMLDEQLNYRLF